MSVVPTIELHCGPRPHCIMNSRVAWNLPVSLAVAGAAVLCKERADVFCAQVCHAIGLAARVDDRVCRAGGTVECGQSM